MNPGTPRVPTATPRSPLVTRPLLLRFVSIIGSSTSFFLLLSVVPLFARSRAGDEAAGASTAALMLATVVGELLTPWFVGRFGYRAALGGGLALLGAATFGFLACHNIEAIVAICVLRGLGFASTIVAGGALTASLLPADRRGEGLALVSTVSGVPALVGTPLGVWIAAHIGYQPVIIAGSLSALIAVASVPFLPDRVRTAGQPVGMLAGLRTPSLARPAIVFATTAVAAGIIVTFLPISVSTAGLVTTALLVENAACIVIRVLVGRYSDRHHPGQLVLLGLLLSVVGMAALADRGPVTILAGAALFGAGFGITQNATRVLMHMRVSPASYGTVNGIWNLAYDGGMGIGVVGFGVVANQIGYPAAFAITAVVMLAGLAPWAMDRAPATAPARAPGAV
jgi:MFS family permease